MIDLGFDGLVNARDVGGVATVDGAVVRGGVLYRSETPQLMTSRDVDRAVSELGVRRVVDLRGSRWGASGPLGDDGRGVGIDFFALAGPPVDEEGSSRDGFLPGLLDRAGPVVGLVLEQLVTTDGATLVHCHTGKDRTGFVIALTLSLVGVSNEDVVADYDRSTPIFETMMRNLEASGRGVPAEAPTYALHPPSAAGARAMLDRLDTEWGGAHAYLLAVGVDAELLDRARSRLRDDRADDRA